MVDGKSRVDPEDFWCQNQRNATNNYDRNGIFQKFFVGEVLTCCMAYLAEARVFLCRKCASVDVVYDPERKHNSGLEIPGDHDFEPVTGKIEYLQSVATPIAEYLESVAPPAENSGV
jgi:hypothetical protein